MEQISIIGAGFAGCEAAWYLANRGVRVKLYEMKPQEFSPAHKSEKLCELVCSNSFKAMRLASAAGLLKAEMKALGSLCVACAEQTAVPAGGALAVDRDEFSALVSEKIENHPCIEVIHEKISDFPQGIVIVATGPLTDGALAEKISEQCGAPLSFYDAAAPIVDAESVDKGFAFTQSRYDRGGEDDYLNCPLNKEEYERFHEALIHAEGAVVHDFDVYEGCMPIEKLAKRGKDAIRFGPMKPVGLTDPKTGHRPWAVLQLRKENRLGTMYNLVGFQTNLKFGEQKRVFSMIPALHDAQFKRYGVMHRNSFIHAPLVLNKTLNLKNNNRLFFAGQITGVEGYMESASGGILAGINALRYARGEAGFVLPAYTMMGALTDYITDTTVKDFQPMGANFGIIPPLEEHIRDKKLRYAALAERSMKYFETLKEET
ncbi:MAG: methylenetetrahydrofolate--tRNA-(uracil(54)-C(5))-methyltransferase (FADH(2)-oxidizing) TrmFO [Clostridia bacterium]|nr:methylenetetrahydrofolate--tRNA-(uracil(54)-C(5))-methyltransferase (FADH(2)-oxidizing) TrmFO [Clostridia bacterium]